MATTNRNKIYVKVTSDFDSTGYMQPRQITWADGRRFAIEQVKDFRPSRDKRHDCFTIVVRGETRLLFFERSDPNFPSRFGRWYVETETPNV